MKMLIRMKKVLGMFLLIIVMVSAFPSLTKADTTDSDWVIVENYSVSGNRMIAGETGTLSLCLRNTNSEKEAKNVVVTLESDSEDIFTAEGLSNQSFIDHIAAGGKYVLDIPLQISQKASGEHYISVNISYINPYSGKETENMVKMHFNVYRSAVEIEEVLLNDATNELSVKYKNAGNSEIYDVHVAVSGNASGGTNDAQTMVAEGESKNIVIPVSFSDLGKQRVKVSVSYTNANGQSVRSDPESFLVSVTNIDAKSDKAVADKKTGESKKTEGIPLWSIIVTCLIVSFAALLIHLMQGHSNKEKKKRRLEKIR